MSKKSTFLFPQRSRLDSHLFCKDSGGELTKITNGGVFTMLTRHSTIPAGGEHTNHDYSIYLRFKHTRFNLDFVF